MVDQGGTVVVVEHNQQIIRHADFVLDLGPLDGGAGGELVFAGTPEEPALCPASVAGKYLQSP